MRVRNSIFIAAIVSGVFASENPFAVEENVQRIEQEESSLLQALSKERAGKEDDELLEKDTAPIVAPKSEEAAVSNEVEKKQTDANGSVAVQEPTPAAVTAATDANNTQAKSDDTPKQDEATPAKEENLSAMQVKEVSAKDNHAKSDKMKSDAVVPKGEKTVATPQTLVLPKKEPKASNKNAETNKSEASTLLQNQEQNKTAKKEALHSVETQIDQIDKKIAEIEEKLKKSREAVMKGEEIQSESVKSFQEPKTELKSDEQPPHNELFEKELQEAIKSVQ